jgi:hypothetical protein
VVEGTGDAEGSEVAGRVRAAIDGQDWDRVRLLLHPYLHWQLADGAILRGRVKVLALLQETGPPDPPGQVELRDGQVYRWTRGGPIDD